MPDYSVINSGVTGYGTIHSLIQFRETLKQPNKPALAIFTYASFHDERNTFLRTRRKTVATYNRLGTLVQPFAKLDLHSQLHYGMANVEYTPFPFMYQSALIYKIEFSYNRLETLISRSKAVTKALFMEIKRIAQENNVHIIVAGIYNNSETSDMLTQLQAVGIQTVDISVDLAVAQNTNLPVDGHPSALAHQQYAEKLFNFLRSYLQLPDKHAANA